LPIINLNNFGKDNPVSAKSIPRVPVKQFIVALEGNISIFPVDLFFLQEVQ
jgi:hypothetical protein